MVGQAGDITTILSDRISNSQMKALEDFVSFVDHLRSVCDSLAPNEILQQMVYRSKFYAHLKKQKEKVPDINPYYEIIAAMENDASLFANRWIRKGKASGPQTSRRRGVEAMVAWLRTLKSPDGLPTAPGSPERLH